jgi:pimeloyl-ACP methyl ester carboxylesterase
LPSKRSAIRVRAESNFGTGGPATAAIAAAPVALQSYAFESRGRAGLGLEAPSGGGSVGSMRVRRLLVRVARIALGFFVLLASIPVGFRARTWFRETEYRGAGPRTGSFVATPSGEFRYQERGGPGGSPVVFIGGTMAPSDTFVPLMDALCDQRLRCLAVDLPPFGYSERAEDGDYGRAQQAGRIVSFVRALRLDAAVLVGHSFGAGPTVETAMRYPDEIRTFALLAGALGLEAGPPSRAIRGILAVPWLRTAVASATLANPWVLRKSLQAFVEDDAVVTDELVERFAAPTRVAGTARAAGSWARTGLFADESESASGRRSSYRRYERPVLLVWGEKDSATPLAQGEELRSLLPNGTLTVIPGVGHFPHVEAQARVVEALRPFLIARRADAGAQ